MASNIIYLPCDTIIYRALRKSWFDAATNTILVDAFFLREGELHLSTDIARLCSPQHCGRRIKKCTTIATLHVGYVKSLGLDVIQDCGVNNSHASIINLPSRQDNEEKAEILAELLLQQSRSLNIIK